MEELSPELLHRWWSIIYDTVTSGLKLCRKCFAIDYVGYGLGSLFGPIKILISTGVSTEYIKQPKVGLFWVHQQFVYF